MIIGLLVHQGLLVREIGALKVGQVDLKAATVMVPETFKTDARKLRLDAVQLMTLHAYLNEDRPQLSRLPGSHSGGGLRKAWISWQMWRMSLLVGLNS